MLIGNFKKNPQPVLWVWPNFFSPLRDTNSKTTHYLLSHSFFQLNTLKGNAKALTVTLLRLNTISHSKTSAPSFLYWSLATWKIRQTYINNSRHLARKYARVFVRGHYLFREANSFPRRAKLEENCKLRGTDDVQGQIFEHIFVPNGRYCLYYPSNLFRNARSF